MKWKNTTLKTEIRCDRRDSCEHIPEKSLIKDAYLSYSGKFDVVTGGKVYLYIYKYIYNKSQQI